MTNDQPSGTPVTTGETYFKSVVISCIEVIQRYLPPDGIRQDDAMNQLIGILDNKEIVEHLSSPLEAQTRFILPTDEQIINTAFVFNDGKLDPEELTNMVSMCMFVVDRLYENGDMLIPSSKENK